MQRFTKHLALIPLCLALPLGCDQRPSGPAGSPSASAAPVASVESKVLASVNGVPITELDVQIRLRGPGSHGGPSSPVPTPAVVETVVREELLRQRALELGLDRDPTYKQKHDEMLGQLTAFERRELGELYYQNAIGNAPRLTDEDAKRYFDENASTIRAELHIEQILFRRDDAGARAALEEIKGGKSFEEVAAAKFPPQAAAGEKKPWDLGWMRWNQMPDQWWGVVFALKPGEVSNIILGGEARLWILKVVERRDNGSITFDEAKPRIMNALERKRSEETRAKSLQELRDKAKIVYTDPALAPPAAPSASAAP
jgi:peptidyl-prolyl cis-trans isomerase C